MPTAVVFNYHNGVYTIDSDSTDYDDSQVNILVWMVRGHYHHALYAVGVLTPLLGHITREILDSVGRYLQRFAQVCILW